MLLFRKIVFTLPKASENPGSYPQTCTVSCLTGLCGNSTISQSDTHYKAHPQSGYADGPGSLARFSAPEGLTFLDGGNIFVVADTGNFLIRLVTLDGNTSTLAGTVIPGEWI